MSRGTVDNLTAYETDRPSVLEGVGLIGLSLALTIAALARAATRHVRGVRG